MPVDAGTPAASGASGSKKKLGILAAAVVAVLVIVGVVVAVVANRTDNSPEGQVKRAISTYTDALASGDLEQLRGITCGAQHDFYQNISAEQFAGVYQTSKEQKSIPVVKSVDAIRITGETAMAQATVYTEADPSKQSARTFDLQNTDGGWKVCDPANAAG
ncbi:nuclear transport factor 2 family protein [Nocardia sp. NPDC127526]|uniref:Rv0361 family membrane protein n=1 Tax=Nocardia sp. NPDC127526 TaxID=3345393 RepID=UPI00362A7A9E